MSVSTVQRIYKLNVYTSALKVLLFRLIGTDSTQLIQTSILTHLFLIGSFNCICPWTNFCSLFNVLSANNSSIGSNLPFPLLSFDPFVYYSFSVCIIQIIANISPKK
eukprot:1144403_1